MKKNTASSQCLAKKKPNLFQRAKALRHNFRSTTQAGLSQLLTSTPNVIGMSNLVVKVTEYDKEERKRESQKLVDRASE